MSYELGESVPHNITRRIISSELFSALLLGFAVTIVYILLLNYVGA